MKKALGLFIGISLLSLLASSQIIIENSSKPQSKNAGRILELEELMRITDESDDFYFKRPFSLNLDQEGFIYFQDDDFFLKFSQEGDYVGNLSHQGQGPGEVQSLRYNIQGETINAWDTRGRKVVLYDLDGQFLREFKPEQHFGMRMVGHYGDSLIFSIYDMPNPEERKGMIEVNHHILLISKDSGEEKEIGALPVPWYVTSTSGVTYAPFLVLPNEDGSTLFINDFPEYRIKVMDTSTGEILRIFQRKYKRVKAPERPPRPGDTRPERKYLYDISYMIRNEEQIWVWTSTADEDKGVLFDVFSPDGEYLDSFYIPKEVSFMYVKGPREHRHIAHIRASMG
jgi:hypothetical protein